MPGNRIYAVHIVVGAAPGRINGQAPKRYRRASTRNISREDIDRYQELGLRRLSRVHWGIHVVIEYCGE